MLHWCGVAWFNKQFGRKKKKKKKKKKKPPGRLVNAMDNGVIHAAAGVSRMHTQ